MTKLNKEDFKVRYELFDKFAVKDQESYYKFKIKQSEKSAGEINLIRATLSLITGLAAAIAATMAQAYIVVDCSPGFFCDNADSIVIGAVIVSILLPAVGGFFSSLADLYQWERLSTIYDAAERNLLVADSMSPYDEDQLDDYIASLYAYVKGTLQVMSDETSQWGQAIREPENVQEFIKEARKRAADVGGDADQVKIGFVDKDGDTPSDETSPDGTTTDDTALDV